MEGFPFTPSGILDKPWTQVVFPSPPPAPAFIFFEHRVQYAHCSSTARRCSSSVTDSHPRAFSDRKQAMEIPGNTFTPRPYSHTARGCWPDEPWNRAIITPPRSTFLCPHTKQQANPVTERSHLFLIPEVFFHSRVVGASPVTTDSIMVMGNAIPKTTSLAQKRAQCHNDL